MTDIDTIRKLKQENERLREWLFWISKHTVLEGEIPSSGPYLNLPPEEGADLALSGNSVSEYEE